MRTTITMLSLCATLACSAQNTLPAVPDSVMDRIALAGDRLVASGQKGSAAMGCALGAGILAGTAAYLSSGDKPLLSTRSTTPFYAAAGVLALVSVDLTFESHSMKIRAGRILRNKH